MSLSPATIGTAGHGLQGSSANDGINSLTVLIAKDEELQNMDANMTTVVGAPWGFNPRVLWNAADLRRDGTLPVLLLVAAPGERDRGRNLLLDAEKWIRHHHQEGSLMYRYELRVPGWDLEEGLSLKEAISHCLGPHYVVKFDFVVVVSTTNAAQL